MSHRPAEHRLEVVLAVAKLRHDLGVGAGRQHPVGDAVNANLHARSDGRLKRAALAEVVAIDEVPGDVEGGPPAALEQQRHGDLEPANPAVVEREDDAVTGRGWGC